MVGLDGPDLGRRQASGEVRILTHRFGQATAKRGSCDVDSRTQQDVRSRIPRLLSHSRAVGRGQALVEGGRQGQRGRECRYGVRAANAVRPVGVGQPRHAQVGNGLELAQRHPDLLLKGHRGQEGFGTLSRGGGDVPPRLTGHIAAHGRSMAASGDECTTAAVAITGRCVRASPSSRYPSSR